MTSDKRDWNAVFTARKRAQDMHRVEELSVAREAAQATGKEPFDPARFRELYAQINADDIDAYTPWDTILKESEYLYYVTFAELMTLADLIEHMRHLDGWG